MEWLSLVLFIRVTVSFVLLLLFVRISFVFLVFFVRVIFGRASFVRIPSDETLTNETLTKNTKKMNKIIFFSVNMLAFDYFERISFSL